MSGLLILGAGGHGKVVCEIAKLMCCWDEIAFLDDNCKLKEVNGVPVVGRFEDAIHLKDRYQSAFVAIGDNFTRMRLIDLFLANGFDVPVLIHPNSCISKACNIDKGSVVMAGAVINPGTVIGRGCIVNTSSSIDHDCIIEDGTHISPGAHIAGTVTIGRNCWICIGASIANNIVIKSGSIVAAGAAAVKSVDKNILVGGVPARFIKENGAKLEEKDSRAG